MTTLYIDRRDAALDCESGSIVLRLAGEKQSNIPIAPLERVVVRGTATISTRLLAELWRNGTGMLLLSGRKAEPTARLLGQPPGDVTLRLGQYALCYDDGARDRLATALILRKLRAQARYMAEAEADLDDRREVRSAQQALARLIAQLVERESLPRASLVGIEGAGAAAYFRGYASLFPASLKFEGRNRRPPRDPVNAALSLGYTLLHFEAVRAAHCAGLDPMIGFFHEPAHGRESLAADLIEPLRTVIDRWVRELFRARDLRADGFSFAEGRCLLGKAARERFYGRYEEVIPPARRLLRLACRAAAREVRQHAPTEA